MSQRTLLDELAEREANVAAREEGIAKINAATSVAWKDTALRAVRTCATLYPQGFTAEDVWTLLEAWGAREGANPAALGPVLRRARSLGVIRPTGAFRERRLDPKHPALPVWRAAA